MKSRKISFINFVVEYRSSTQIRKAYQDYKKKIYKETAEKISQSMH